MYGDWQVNKLVFDIAVNELVGTVIVLLDGV
jgi:hypothetical protein